MESSNHSFSLALKVFLEHDLSVCLHPCGILVQEVSDERDVVFLMSSIFAVGTRQMTMRTMFFLLIGSQLLCLFAVLIHRLLVMLYELAKNVYLGLSHLNTLEGPYQISAL